MRWLRIGLIVFLAVLFLSGVALAVIYNNRAQFQGNVNVVAASPGLVIDNPQVIFPDIAPGLWGVPVPVTVRNTGMDTYTSLRLESTSPAGLGLYMITPPIMPLPPGDSVIVPISVYALPGFALGAYSFDGWIIGEK